MRRLVSALAIALGVGLLALGCDNGQVTLATQSGPVDASVTAEAGIPPGLGVGQTCDATHVCRAGLACTNAKCAPGHSLPDGSPCVLNSECKTGDYCGPNRTCVAGGAGADGAPCTSDADCATGLRCDLVGLAAQCKPEGQGDVGGACVTGADCLGGLSCANKTCEPLPPTPGPTPLGLPSWKGVDCNDDPGATQAYFHVPRGSNDGDFFRLPFPNDVRLKNGHPDLTGFPTPGTDLVGFDIVDRYARDVEQSTDGFSAYPTVTFRFSNAVDFGSLKQQGVVRWVDVTPGGQGSDLGFGWSATTGRNQYVCPNSLSARPPQGAPLAPGSVNAVLIMTGARAADGSAIQRSPDLDALLGASAPSDPALAAAYPAYKPLRDWMTAKSVSASTIIDAAVFTVAHVESPAQKLAQSIAKASAPTAAQWVKCGGSTPSPCPQATGDRACGAGDPAFDELHALVTLPIFQKGNEPYLAPSDGGDLAYDASGVPQQQRTEQVCLALTIPKGATGPLPLVIYAHGTGGSFRSHVTDGTAGRLAKVDVDGGGQIGIAVLGIDQVEHGTRRGSSTDSPNDLFYNFANPGAARGNPLQGAADQMSLLRFAQSFDLPAAQSPTGAEIKFGAVAFWGHSQGATEGAIAVPYVNGGHPASGTPGIVGAVLSGEGASLIDALLSKRSPVDIADAVPVVLEDPGVSQAHPVLALLQNAVDVADPLNHARALAAQPPTGLGAKHVFQPYGTGDTYAPPVTEATYALAASLGLVAPAPSVSTADPIGALVASAPPVAGNLTDGADKISAFVREYSPNGFDGHFVAYKDQTAQADVAHFLADVLSGKVPPKVAR